MRNPQGYAVWVDPIAPIIERDTYTCVHCNAVVFVAPRQPPEGHCRPCNASICGACADAGVCTPFMKKIEEQETVDYHRRQNAKVLGG